MDILKDIYYTNRSVVKKSFQALFKFEQLLLIGIPYLIVILIAYRFSYSLSFFAGIIIFATLSAVISDYIFVIENIVKYGKFNWNIFKYGYKVYFRKIFALLFIYYIVDYGIKLFLMPVLSVIPGGFLIPWVLKFGILLVFNALPETIYNKGYDEIDSLKYSIKFIKENIFSWFVPNTLLLVFLMSIYKMIFEVVSLATTSFSYSVSLAIDIVVVAIFVQAVLGFILIYRGYLFRVLDSTTRKKRLFMRYMDNE